MQSIVDYGEFDPAVDPVFHDRYNCDGRPFEDGPCTASGNYWSSTTNANNPNNAWNVNFNNGNVNNNNKNNTKHVRAVRGGS